MGEQDAGDAEVAEEGERLDALAFHAVVASFSYIAVFGQKAVKGSDDVVIDGQQVGVEGDQGPAPRFVIGIGGMLCEVGGVHIPYNSLFKGSV